MWKLSSFPPFLAAVLHMQSALFWPEVTQQTSLNTYTEAPLIQQMSADVKVIKEKEKMFSQRKLQLLEDHGTLDKGKHLIYIFSVCF